jgi:predicted chitinase
MLYAPLTYVSSISENKDYPNELATAHAQNEDKYNIKTGTGIQITGAKRSWTPEQKMEKSNTTRGSGNSQVCNPS